MSFSLIAQGLLLFGYLSGAYQSLKILKLANRTAKSRDILKYWSVLATITIYTTYLEVFLSWFPFYYFFKSISLAFIVVPNSRVPDILFEALVIPFVQFQKEQLNRHVKPRMKKWMTKMSLSLESLTMQPAIESLSQEELDAYQNDLSDRIKRC